MAGLREVRLTDGNVIDMESYLDWSLYSTVEAENTAAIDLEGFTYVVGDSIPQAGAPVTGQRNARPSDTNHDVKKRMNHDESMIVFSLSSTFFALEGTPGLNAQVQAPDPLLSGTNLARIQFQMLMRLFVGADIIKPEANAPIAWFGQQPGPWYYGTANTLTVAGPPAAVYGINVGTTGVPGPNNTRCFQIPIYIEPDRTMYSQLFTPAGPVVGLTQDWRCRMWLNGLKSRVL